METESQQPKEREGVVSVLNGFIEVFNLAKEVSGNTPAKAIFGSVSVILAMIRDAMANEADYVELGLACADVCTALKRGLEGKEENDLNDSVQKAIEQLRKAMEEIQGRITKQRNRNVVFQHLHAKNDKERIAAWRLDLNRILHVFNAELAIDTHVTVSDIHTMVTDLHRSQKGNDGKLLTQASVPGEPLPPPPRTFFGRDELIKKLVGLAEDLRPIALIGAGGIGKTSIALTVLHNDRIKKRFGHNRRFIRCDKFPASRAHFLRQLSGVIGASVENPGDLSLLREFLSSKEMLIVLDNAESILDPQGVDAREIYTVVEELSQFENLCILITSRISTIPPDCKHLDIPTLSVDAARDTFYRIYDDDNPANPVDSILEQLDFHPLSITLLATVARQNRWSVRRLGEEWEERRTKVLVAEHSSSLAATIELSLASPLFQRLGPDARSVLEVVAFFPQGVDEKNLGWLFPTISDRADIFNKFCMLSLTYRSGGFVTMLAPLRDYLSPKDPGSSSLLRAVKECYFSRMSVSLDPSDPGFADARWIISEDTNVEHLLDVFSTIDAGSNDVWEACSKFMEHLYCHKVRLTILGPRIEGLPDDHCSKPGCLLELGKLVDELGNWAECKRLHTHSLKLWRERGNECMVAQALRLLSLITRRMGLCKEGIEQAKEAMEIDKKLGNTTKQIDCLNTLASLFRGDKQLDAAEEAASRAINLVGENGNQFQLCESHRVLGQIYRSKGKTDEAVFHFKTALEIATPFDWQGKLFWIHYTLTQLFREDGRLEDAQTHIEHTKLYTTKSPYYLPRVMLLQARIWREQHKLEEARSEALRAADCFEKLGAARNLESCMRFLRAIEQELDAPV